jgi:ribosomal protein L10
LRQCAADKAGSACDQYVHGPVLIVFSVLNGYGFC